MRTTTTLIGTVGTVPETGLLPSGTPYANFRLAVNGSRFDRERQEWVSTTTSWFDIKAYDQLATAMGMSVGGRGSARGGRRALGAGLGE